MRISPNELQRLTVAIEKSNLSVVEVIDLIDNHGKQIKKVLCASHPLSITVDYDESVENLIKECGCVWNDPDINELNFPSSIESPSGKVNLLVKLFYCPDNFKDDIFSKEIIEEMQVKNYRTAYVKELLVFGKTYPQIQRQCPILALSSVWKDSRGVSFVPRLYINEQDRILDTGFFEGAFTSGFYFLGISLTFQSQEIK